MVYRFVDSSEKKRLSETESFLTNGGIPVTSCPRASLAKSIGAMTVKHLLCIDTHDLDIQGFGQDYHRREENGAVGDRIQKTIPRTAITIISHDRLEELDNVDWKKLIKK